jgi:hypothetical protein
VLLDHRSGEGFSRPIASKMSFARCVHLDLGVARLRAAASKASALFRNTWEETTRTTKNRAAVGYGIIRPAMKHPEVYSSTFVLGAYCLRPALEDNNIAPLCDEGYTCAYLNTLSWTSPTTPLPMENDPRLVFKRFFGEESVPEERALRTGQNRSILDTTTGTINKLAARVGAKDRLKLDQYLTSIREAEARLQAHRKPGQGDALDSSGIGRPLGVPEKFDDYRTDYDHFWGERGL